MCVCIVLVVVVVSSSSCSRSSSSSRYNNFWEFMNLYSCLIHHYMFISGLISLEQSVSFISERKKDKRLYSDSADILLKLFLEGTVSTSLYI